MTLGEQLDGVKLVRYDEESELTFAWFGGHGVHIYESTGQEVDFFNTGDVAQNDVPEAEIIEAIKEKQAEYHEANQ